MDPNQRTPKGAVSLGFILFASLKKSCLTYTWIYATYVKSREQFQDKNNSGGTRVNMFTRSTSYSSLVVELRHHEDLMSFVQCHLDVNCFWYREYYWVSFDIKFTRQGFENTCWHREACRAIQHAFSKPSLTNLISKDADLVFYLSVYPLFHFSNLRLWRHFLFLCRFSVIGHVIQKVQRHPDLTKAYAARYTTFIRQPATMQLVWEVTDKKYLMTKKDINCNSLHANDYFCPLLIAFAISLDPGRHNKIWVLIWIQRY